LAGIPILGAERLEAIARYATAHLVFVLSVDVEINFVQIGGRDRRR
jgi:hypothetical protein